jgi:hypothetical protein
MPYDDLLLPLLEFHRENSDDQKTPEPISERHVQFRIQLTDSDEPYSKPHRSKPLKSALKKSSTKFKEESTKELPMEASTAAIIKKIQQKYEKHRPLIIERQALRSEQEKLNKDATCCKYAGCSCCVTGTLLGTGLAAAALATASCQPWNAVIAAPFCLSAFFCKTADIKEKHLHNNFQRDRELLQQLAAPEPQLMQP